MPHMNACIGFLPLHRALAVLTIAAGLLAAATLAFDIPEKRSSSFSVCCWGCT